MENSNIRINFVLNPSNLMGLIIRAVRTDYQFFIKGVEFDAFNKTVFSKGKVRKKIKNEFVRWST